MLTILFSISSLLLLPLFKTSLMWSTSSIALMLISTLSILFIFPYTSEFLTIFSQNSFSDHLSSPLIILTLWVSSLMIIASYQTLTFNKSSYSFLFLIILLNTILLFTFSQSNIMMFYVFFEASLLPTLFLILGWGYQPERLQASFYLMIYTVAASLPLLIILSMLFNTNYSLMFFNFFWYPISSMKVIWWFFLIFAFLVKMPMYLVHLWLPKAHVEAPVAGSMILAAILLKLGSYGLLRMTALFPFINKMIAPMIIAISMWGAIITSTICIRQPDMKSLIAYSSVGHMGLLTSGLMSNSTWGWEGSLMMMIAHGLCSSALFALANTLYESTQTRSLFLTKGMLAMFPTMTIFWFLSSAANMAAPPTLNLASEIFLLTAILFSSTWLLPLIAMSSFLAAAYSLFLYTSTQHGSPIDFSNPMTSFSQRSLFLFIMHLTPLFIIITKIDFIMNWSSI